MNIETVSLEKLYPFKGYPFRIQKDEALDELAASIAFEGVFNPIIVRPIENGDYEIVSGHRRYEACKLAGVDKIPAIVRDISRDEATIIMVDDNLTQRSEILPSEKAFAYKMKMDAMNRKGYRTDLDTSYQVDTRLDSAEDIGKKTGDSRAQVFRYIRLTCLVPELLKMVDEGRIAFGPAVELSYLTSDEQQNLYETIVTEEATPSLSQAQRMRRISETEGLDIDTVSDILSEIKGNQVESIRLPASIVQQHFKRYVTPKEMQEFITKAVDFYCRYLKNRERNNDAR